MLYYSFENEEMFRGVNHVARSLCSGRAGSVEVKTDMALERHESYLPARNLDSAVFALTLSQSDLRG